MHLCSKAQTRIWWIIGDEQAIISNPINYTRIIIVNEKFSEHDLIMSDTIL